MNYADKLRRTRNNIQYCYLQYNGIRQKKPKSFVAFFEGYDAPYYLPYIEAVLGSTPEQVICGNKRNVIAVHDSFITKNINCSNTGFFIDRDYDDNSVMIQRRQDFYITEGYSVENYYCSQLSFERILKSYMHYNCAHKDYDSLVANYVELREQYNSAILEFNGWYCSLKRDRVTVSWSLKESMPAGYVYMDLSQFVIKKNYSMTMVHKDYPTNPQPLPQSVKDWSMWILKNPVYNIRGKYEFDFLLEYLRSLSKMVNDSSTAFEEHVMNFNMGQREALSALAQYADKDDVLKEYIQKRAS